MSESSSASSVSTNFHDITIPSNREVTTGCEIVLMAGQRCHNVFTAVNEKLLAGHESVDFDKAWQFMQDELPNAIFLVAALVRLTQLNALQMGVCHTTETLALKKVRELPDTLLSTALNPLMLMWEQSNMPDMQVHKIHVATLWIPQLCNTSGRTDRHNLQKLIASTTHMRMEDALIERYIQERDWRSLASMTVHAWIEAPTLQRRTEVVNECIILAGRLLNSWKPIQLSDDTNKGPERIGVDSDKSSWIYFLTHIVFIATEYGVTGHVDMKDDMMCHDNVKTSHVWSSMRTHLKRWFRLLTRTKKSERINRELVLELATCLCLLSEAGARVEQGVRSYLCNTLLNEFEDHSKGTLLPKHTFLAKDPIEEQWHTDYHLHVVGASAMMVLQRMCWLERFSSHSYIDRHIHTFASTGLSTMDQIVRVDTEEWIWHARQSLETHGYVLIRGIASGEELTDSRRVLETEVEHCTWLFELDIPTGQVYHIPSSSNSSISSMSQTSVHEALHNTKLMQQWNPARQSMLQQRLLELTRGQAVYVPHGSYVRCKKANSDKLEAFTVPHADYYAYKENMALFGPLSACNEQGAEQRQQMNETTTKIPEFATWLKPGIRSPAVDIDERHSICLLCNNHQPVANHTEDCVQEHSLSDNGNMKQSKQLVTDERVEQGKQDKPNEQDDQDAEDEADKADKCDGQDGQDEQDEQDKEAESNEEELLLCDICDCAFHNHCLPQPLIQLPELGEWHCPLCANKAHLGVYTAWIPLQPLSAAEQGVLCVLPKSHKFDGFDDHVAQAHRLPTQFLRECAQPQLIDEATAQHIWHIPPAMEVGDAVIFNIKTVHGATCNTTTHPRYSFDIRFSDGLIHPKPCMD